MSLTQRKNSTCFICFGISNLSDLAIVKSLSKFGGCLLNNNTNFLLKTVLSSLFLILSKQLWNFFKPIIWLGF